jgi:hypothetical protein
VASALAIAGCSGSALPGTLLGTYAVTGHKLTNTCGDGIGEQDPWSFDVQLSRQGSTLYWSWLDGTALLSGSLDAQSQATLTMTQQGDVDVTADGSVGPCAMERDDTLEVTLASGSLPASFSGTIGYAFSVLTGADCSDQLATAGGMYATLPCSVTYSMTASRK